ncbi:MAG: phenylalanine--tRNA ligase subunit beta [Bacteriovoracaceae bacterium]
MRIPLNWLKKYIDIKVSDKKLAALLTMSGTEVERLATEDDGSLGNVVIGEILTIEKHPDADRLHILKVDIQKEVLQIVCGAPNIEVGQKVPVALVGAKLGELEVKEAEIRGVKSYGMICSESELGISDDHSGIMVLDPRATSGQTLEKEIKKEEGIFEAEITPNRGDCLSIIGIAREVAALTGEKIKEPKVKVTETNLKVKAAVEIKDQDLCYRYMGRIIESIEIDKSPAWLVEALASYGVRSINNLVDITNFVMIELGHPLHAFDFDKISESSGFRRVIVRKATEGEELVTLDGERRQLTKDMLVIADSEKALGVAGVMGGLDSEITDQTTRVFLESANFNPTSIRRTGHRLGLRSEASNRFEKGLPLELTERALDRTASLIKEIIPKARVSRKIDEGEVGKPPRRVVLRLERLKTFLGAEISVDRIIEILRSLEFEIEEKRKESLKVKVPYWRLDVSIEEDLLEEIARIYGYQKLPVTLPTGSLPSFIPNQALEMIARIRCLLADYGFFEVYSYSFTDKKDANLWNQEASIKIANPLSREQEFMRTDLLGSFLDIINKNKAYPLLDTIKIFEISPVYKTKNGEVTEETKLTGLIYGRGFLEMFEEVKGVTVGLLESLGVDEKSRSALTSKILPLNARALRDKGIKTGNATIFEIDLAHLEQSIGIKRFQPISKYPGAIRDLSFEIQESVEIKEILKQIKMIPDSILKKVIVLDVFRGKSLGEGKKSVTLRFYYQSDERTLVEQEIDTEQEKAISKITNSLGGILRGVKK